MSALQKVGQLARVYSPVALFFAAAVAAYQSLIFSDPARVAELNAFEAFTFEPAGGSPVLILTLTAWLLYRRLPRISAGTPTTASTVLATALLVIACSLCLWSHFVSLPQIQTLSLFVMIFSFGTFVGGAKGARAVLVPGCFVLLAYTPPGVLINQIVYPMQISTAKATTMILEAFGATAQHLNDLILTNGSVFQVIETCSGLRTTSTLLMSSVVYNEIFDRKRGRALTLVLVSPVLGIFVNQIRVLSIVLNPYAREELVHTAQGLLMVVFGVLGLALIDGLIGLWISRRASSSPRARRTRPQHAASAPLAWSPRVMVFIAALVATSLGPWLIPSWKPHFHQQPALATLPGNLDGWQGAGIAIDRQFLGTVHFSSWLHRRYTKGENTVEVFMAADVHRDPRFSLISPKTAILEPGLPNERLGTVMLPGGTQIAEAIAIYSVKGGALAFHWYAARESLLKEVVRAVLGLDLSPFRRPLRTEVTRISTPLTDMGAATAILQDFARLFLSPPRENSSS